MDPAGSNRRVAGSPTDETMPSLHTTLVHKLRYLNASALLGEIFEFLISGECFIFSSCGDVKCVEEVDFRLEQGVDRVEGGSLGVGEEGEGEVGGKSGEREASQFEELERAEKLKPKMEIVEEKEKVQAKEEINTLCTNEISVAMQDMPRVKMLPAAEGGEAKVEKEKKIEKNLGWREALAVDPLLADLHLQLDHIFFPQAKVCQVPLDV